MGAPLSVPRRLLSIEEFYRLGEAGVLKEEDHVELIQGEMIQMAPIGGPHLFAVNEFNRQFSLQLGGSGIISVQNPIALPPNNVPQPDIAILSPATHARRSVPGANDVLLLIEVAHTTLEYDRDVKIPLYASHGIDEVWLWNVKAQALSVSLEPSPGGYQRVLTLTKDETISPTRLPHVTIRLIELV